MSFSIFPKAILALAVGTSFLLVSCGKKAETVEQAIPERVPLPQTSDVERMLEKQDVSCESSIACPNYISKVVTVHGDKLKFCTGFLTNQYTVATSASCLPSLLRLNGQDCSRDVFFFFPKTLFRPSERVGCSKVLLVSQMEGNDPILWRDDVAFLQMAKPINYRRNAQISRDGIYNNRFYTTWMIDQQNEFSAIIKKTNCESLHNNYVNPLVLNESSPNMLFADCTLTNGSAGAPIIDSRGKVRAMISRGMDTKLRSYLESTGLLVNGLKEMLHATNFACAPTVDDSNVLDERECLKDLTYAKVDQLRSEMLSTENLFGEMKKKFEASLVSISKHIQFGVKLVSKGDSFEADIYPKCFKPLSGWLESLNDTRNLYVDNLMLPVKSFKKAMDHNGRITGVTVDSPEKDMFIQFSLKSLRSTKKSSILMWANGENNNVRTFPNIAEECPASLL